MAKKFVPAQVEETPSSSLAPAEAFVYVGKDPDRQWLAGVPARDLDADTFQALRPELREQVRSSPWYAPASSLA